jgi:hypothetical protein
VVLVKKGGKLRGELNRERLLLASVGKNVADVAEAMVELRPPDLAHRCDGFQKYDGLYTREEMLRFSPHLDCACVPLGEFGVCIGDL